jgi:hypothetical protein
MRRATAQAWIDEATEECHGEEGLRKQQDEIEKELSKLYGLRHQK